MAKVNVIPNKDFQKVLTEGVKTLNVGANKRNKPMDRIVRRNATILDKAGREWTLESGDKVYTRRAGISGPKEDFFLNQNGSNVS